jgi:tetratricopeptide (TPR) repeat protein
MVVELFWKNTGIKKSGILLFAVIAFFVVSPVLSAEVQILQDIQISEEKESAVIQINLGIPVRYVRHFPPNAGEILQIQLDVLDNKLPSNISKRDIMVRQSLVPPANDLVPLVHVTYEGDVPGGPYVTLRFEYGVEYKVEDGEARDDFHSLFIIVKRDVLGLSIRGSGERGPLISEEKLDELMAQARRTLARGDYNRAIQLFNKLLKLPPHKYSRDAKELLGLARERKGHIARAKLEYQDYIRMYPKGEGTERVKQRLAALNAQQFSPRAKLKAVAKEDEGWRVDTFGRFLQRFYWDTTEFATGSSTDRASLTSIANISSRVQTREHDTRIFFNAHDVRDFQDSGENETRLNTFYLDTRQKDGLYAAKLGRQSSSKGGVFGRFDGLWGSYQLTPNLMVNATVGQPVDFSSSDIEANKFFYGASVGLGSSKDKWDGDIYFIDQYVESIVDRRAIGGDVRYADQKYSLFNSVDYDISYNQLNIFLLRSSWQVNEDFNLNANYSYRRSPITFSTNALQQERLTSFSELLDLSSEEAIRDKVEKLKSETQLFTFGAAYKFDTNLQLNGDLSVSTISEKPAVDKLNPPADDPANATIQAIEASGPDYFTSLQLISTNYFVERDINIIGLRYSDRDTRNTVMIFARSRFPYHQKWRIGPRISVEQSNITRDNSKLLRYSLSAKIDYRVVKWANFNFEAGYDSYDYTDGAIPDYTRTYTILGYYVDF